LNCHNAAKLCMFDVRDTVLLYHILFPYDSSMRTEYATENKNKIQSDQY
jgi:hypothetical protein